MIIAAIAVILMAAIGIGYAYTATTANTGNTANAEYLIISQSDGTDAKYSAAFTEDLEYDTVTVLTDKGELADPRYVEEVQYTIHGGEEISGHNYAKLGQIYLIIDESRSSEDYNIRTYVTGATGLDLTNYNYHVMYLIGSGEDLEDATDAAEAAEGELIAMTLSGSDAVAVTADAIDNDGDNAYTVAIVQIYASLKTGDTYTLPLASPLNATVLDTVTFGFQAVTA